MEKQNNKHENYEILNLIGYGLSKFNNQFINEFGFTTKSAFYTFCVNQKIAETVGTIKNRMDLFDPFFPNNRKGWWQKGDTYIHRKLQETGLEAELYFINNYKNINLFNSATIEDARLFGDGYDFQVKTEHDYFLAEIKGIREEKGKFRLTEKV